MPALAAQPDSPRRDHSQRIADGVAIALLLCAAWLRFWRLGEIQIFADEIHSLHFAAQKSFGWIATHFTRNDACIPYTLYNRLLAETIGLGEFSMRLPAALAGALVPLVSWCALRREGHAWTAAIVAGVLGLSPYLVYLSREARPYPIVMLLVTLAGILLLGARSTTSTRRLCSAAALLGLAAWFHPIAIPGGLVLWGLPLLQARKADAPPRALRSWAIATALGLATVGLLLGPAAGSLFESLGQKGAKGGPGLETIESGLVLLHGLRAAVPVWAWALGAALGLFGVWRARPLHTATIASMLALQLAAVQLARPHLSDIPWVWDRYWIHLWPLLVISLGVGFAQLLAPLGARFAALGPAAPRLAAAALLASFASYGLHIHSVHGYALRATDVQPAHPIAFFIDDALAAETLEGPRFYRQLAKLLPADAVLIESPRSYAFPLQQRYSSIHRHRVFTAGLDVGFLQRVPEKHPGFRFRTVWGSRAGPGGDGPVFWLHHRRVKRELAEWIRFARQDRFAARQLEGAEHMFQARAAEGFFGPDPQLASFEPERLGFASELVLETPSFRLFRLRGER